MNSALVGPFDFSAGLLVMFAVFRALWLLIGETDRSVVDDWRRRWIEVLGAILVGVVLFIVGRQFI